MTTIQAAVNPRLLTKANRLFTGSLEGRIIEILQNARRAGATEVEISNRNGIVTVRDNGRGIEDFRKLLDLGGSGWEEILETSEDPAGVGIFCLAPRDVTIQSNGKMVTINADGWTGAPVTVHNDTDSVQGTLMRFKDDPWTPSAVDPKAVFSGLAVTVDGTTCPKSPFVSDSAAHHPELGCRIEVRQSQNLDPWHHSTQRARWHSTNCLVNFHGQVVALDYRPVSEHYRNAPHSGSAGSNNMIACDGSRRTALLAAAIRSQQRRIGVQHGLAASYGTPRLARHWNGTVGSCFIVVQVHRIVVTLLQLQQLSKQQGTIRPTRCRRRRRAHAVLHRVDPAGIGFSGTLYPRLHGRISTGKDIKDSTSGLQADQRRHDQDPHQHRA